MFMYQETCEWTHGPCHHLDHVAVPFSGYKTPADEVTSVSHECGHDKKNDFFSMFISDIKCESKNDYKVEDDGFCDPLSRHTNDRGSGMFRDTCCKCAMC